MKTRKQDRLLIMYGLLRDGVGVCKSEMMHKFKIGAKTFDRDINELRMFLADYMTYTDNFEDIIYDPGLKRYILV